MKNCRPNIQQIRAEKWNQLSSLSRRALETLVCIDVPAKGRIAHHIRTGRLQRALELCEAGKHYVWKHTAATGSGLLEQKLLWIRLWWLLRRETGSLPFLHLKGTF